MTVVREYTINELALKDQFVTAQETVTAGQSLPSNMLLQGATMRTSTSFGRSATVKAGEDIRPALESLRSAGGGTLILLAGVHNVSYDIIGASKINIVGEGIDQTIIDFGGGAYGIRFVGVSATLVKGFSVSKLTIQNSNATSALHINYGSTFLIEDIYINSCDQDGVGIYGATNFLVSNVASNGNTGDGFYLTGATGINTNYFQLDNCRALSNTGNGFFIFSDNSTGAVGYFSFYNAVSISNGANGFLVDGNTEPIGSFYTCFGRSNTLDGFYLDIGIITLVACEADGNQSDGFVANAGKNTLIGCYSYNNTSFDYVNNSSYQSTFIACAGDYGNVNSLSAGYTNIGGGALQNAAELMEAIWAIQSGTVSSGHVVVYANNASGNYVATTTTVGDDKVCGVVVGVVSSGGVDYRVVATRGKVTNLKVDGTTDIAIGDFLCTYSVAGIAAKAGAGDMAFAIALEAYTTNDSNGVIDALIISPRKL